jgi:hypothetical protein
VSPKREPDVDCRPPLAPIGRHGTCVHEARTPPLVFDQCEQLHARPEACKGLSKTGLKGGAEVEDPKVIAAGIRAVGAGGAARAGPLDRLNGQRVLAPADSPDTLERGTDDCRARWHVNPRK